MTNSITTNNIHSIIFSHALSHWITENSMRGGGGVVVMFLYTEEDSDSQRTEVICSVSQVVKVTWLSGSQYRCSDF